MAQLNGMRWPRETHLMPAGILTLCAFLLLAAAANAVAENRYWVSIGSYTQDSNARAALEEATRLTGGYFELRYADGYVRLVSGPHDTRIAAERSRDEYRTRGYDDSWVWAEEAGFEYTVVDEVQPEFAEALSSSAAAPELVEETPDNFRLNKLNRPAEPAADNTAHRDWFAGTNFDVRFKAFSSAGFLPDHDLQRSLQGTPVSDHSFDMRMMLEQKIGPVTLTAHHSTVLVTGDRQELDLNADSALDQTVVDDRNRRWRWTWDIEDGSRHQSFHRLDRLALQWQTGSWGFTVGRDAVSWGGGIVFQPMDLFSPFSPTVVDRDYKAGDDLILVDRLLGNGHDLQLLHIARRDEFSEVDQDVASSALKWHGYVGPVEFELLGAEHFGNTVFGGAIRVPVGRALVRADLIASEDDAGDYVYTGMINADISFMLWDRNAYTFIEYFHNGWGVTELPDNPLFLPADLTDRLARGELFNLMKNYAAAGFNYEWHPLINHNTTVIANLHDNSLLLQMGVTYTPSDNQSLQVGWLEPIGDAGEEFGGVPLFGASVTSGGASRAYFRWVIYL